MLLKNINIEEIKPAIPLDLNVILFSLLLYIVHCLPICSWVERDTIIIYPVLAQPIIAFYFNNQAYVSICFQI